MYIVNVECILRDFPGAIPPCIDTAICEHNMSIKFAPTCLGTSKKRRRRRRWRLFIESFTPFTALFEETHGQLVQTGSVGPPSLLQNGYRGSFPGVKRPGRGVNHLPPSSTEVKERVELHIYSLSVPPWPVLGWSSPFFSFTCIQVRANKLRMKRKISSFPRLPGTH